MSRKRIALLFEYSTLNGGERSMLATLDWLKKNDPRFEFTAIAPAVGRLADALREREIPVVDWSLNDTLGRRRSTDDIESNLCQIVESLQADLLHSNSLAMGRLTGRMVLRRPIRTTTHLRDIIKLSSGAIADLNRNCRLVAVSHATSAFHINQGLDAGRTNVIHNGVDLTIFQPRTITGRLHTELALPFDLQRDDIDQKEFESPSALSQSRPRKARLIVTIGQIGLRKGQDILAAAAPMILERVPETHFLIVGERTSQKIESHEFEKSIYSSFAESGLIGRLHVLGQRDDVSRLLNEVDLLIHPANQEPFGRVLLEATAAGVPIVATNVGGTSEIVANGITGTLVPPRSPTELANAAIELLTNESKAIRFRNASRDRAVREFPIAMTALKMGNLWATVLDQK